MNSHKATPNYEDFQFHSVETWIRARFPRKKISFYHFDEMPLKYFWVPRHSRRNRILFLRIKTEKNNKLKIKINIINKIIVNCDLSVLDLNFNQIINFIKI